MATNTFVPIGCTPYANGGGAAIGNFVLRPMLITYNYGTKIYKGDPVQMDSGGTGYIKQWSAGTAVSFMAGIFWGCEYVSVLQGHAAWYPYWPAASSDTISTTVVRAYVIPTDLASAMWFLVQSDATGIVQGNVGNNIDLNMGTGSTTTGLSGAYLDTTTISTVGTKPFKIMRLYSDAGGVDNGSYAGANNKAFVAANITGSTGI